LYQVAARVHLIHRFKDCARTQEVFPQDCSVGPKVTQLSVYAPPLWHRLSSGVAITTERLRTWDMGSCVSFDPKCPAADLTLTSPSSADGFCSSRRINIESVILYLV
jgi:hypothetical protein